MVQIKSLLLSADALCLLISGYSFLGILEHGVTLSAFDGYIATCASIAALVYLLVRIYNYTAKGILDRKYRREEIIALQNENHKNNPYKYMKSKLTEDNHENLKK